MDNASKALLMAGGVLLAMLIISVALYIVAGLRGFANAANTNAEVSAVESFNRYYVSFGDTITGIDVVNIVNKVHNDRDNDIDISVNSAAENYAKTLEETIDRIGKGQSSNESVDINSLTDPGLYSYSYELNLDGYIASILITKNK